MARSSTTLSVTEVFGPGFRTSSHVPVSSASSLASISVRYSATAGARIASSACLRALETAPQLAMPGSRTRAPSPLMYRLGAYPQALRNLPGVHALLEHLRSLQPHLLTASPALSGQPATIRIPRKLRRRADSSIDHAGTPNVIKTDKDSESSTSVVANMLVPGNMLRDL
jgi:hypothetical protein